MIIKKVKIYYTDEKGNPTFHEEKEYEEKMWIPNVGNLIRFDSGKHNNDLYEIIGVNYLKSSQVIKIKCQLYCKAL